MLLTLVRHGESESNARLSTSKDSHLTPLGRMQAERAATALTGLGIEKLYCSPQQRALETAEILARALGVAPCVWVDLSEHGFSGPETGLPRSEMARRFPAYHLPPEVDEAGWARHWSSETPEELSARMRRVGERIEAWAAAGTYRSVACVIHGTSGNDLVRYLLRVDPSHPVRFRHHNCGITQIRYEEEGKVRVLALNDLRHLAELPESSKPDADVLPDGSEAAAR